jgi:hypothetical protein
LFDLFVITLVLACGLLFVGGMEAEGCAGSSRLGWRQKIGCGSRRSGWVKSIRLGRVSWVGPSQLGWAKSVGLGWVKSGQADSLKSSSWDRVWIVVVAVKRATAYVA